MQAEGRMCLHMEEMSKEKLEKERKRGIFKRRLWGAAGALLYASGPQTNTSSASYNSPPLPPILHTQSHTSTHTHGLILNPLSQKKKSVLKWGSFPGEGSYLRARRYITYRKHIILVFFSRSLSRREDKIMLMFGHYLASQFSFIFYIMWT